MIWHHFDANVLERMKTFETQQEKKIRNENYRNIVSF